MDKALHPYQCTCLSHIVKTLRSRSEDVGVARCRLISSLYKSVSERVWSEYQAQAKKGHLEYINPLNMNHESGILEL